jgi:hypothetical protein
LDLSGTITNRDIQMLLDIVPTLAGSGSVSAVPEPSSWMLAPSSLLAAAALLERAASLTPDPARRAERQLAAAWRKCDGGALDAALALLAAVEAGPEDAMQAAEAQHLRGQIAYDQRRAVEAARLLLSMPPGISSRSTAGWHVRRIWMRSAPRSCPARLTMRRATWRWRRGPHPAPGSGAGH